MRGYGDSGRPRGRDAYRIAPLVAAVAARCDARPEGGAAVRLPGVARAELQALGLLDLMTPAARHVGDV